ncbi:MAG: aldo/keto reductase [Christensenellales bacterium]|jgi:aryl-alcohol dehydrogenase-like predicted oxidoreductase
MEKRSLGNTGYRIWPVVYGGIVSMDDGQDASDRYVAMAVDRGVNYFDVAPSYGDAQEKLGNSLRPYRQRVYLACKTQCRLRDQAQEEFETSLRMLYTDHFDVYQMHSLSTFEDLDQAFGPGGVMEMMLAEQRAGRIRKLGITAHSEAVALKALELYPFDTVLFPLNWGLHLAQGMGGEISAAAKARGVGLLGMKGLIHRAWLSDQERASSAYPKSWCKPFSPDQEALAVAALRYALSLGADALVPPGNIESFSFVLDHIEDCLAQPLSDADRALLTAELPHIQGHAFF